MYKRYKIIKATPKRVYRKRLVLRLVLFKRVMFCLGKKLRTCTRGIQRLLAVLNRFDKCVPRNRVHTITDIRQNALLRISSRANRWLHIMQLKRPDNYTTALIFKRHVFVFMHPGYSKTFFSNGLKLGLFKRLEYSISSKY